MMHAAFMLNILTVKQVEQPIVSVFPAVSSVQLGRKSSLLCAASAMFPPVVQISWRRREEDAALEELQPGEGEQLELREPGRTTAILLVDRRPRMQKYLCLVQHEGGAVEAREEQVVPPLLPCLYKVRLLVLLYTALIVKSLVYCCGLCLLRILRNQPASITCTHAD